MNPFEQMPVIPEPDELIEVALSRANRVSIQRIRDRDLYVRRLLVKKLITSYDYVENKLKIIKDWYRNLDNVSTFYDELLDVIIGKEEFRNSIERVIGILPTIKKLRKTYVSKIKRSQNPRRDWREGIGRLSSIIRRRRGVFRILSDARIKLSSLPSIDNNYPLVVIGGPPNVGKSSLVNAISTARTRVASYPFTTRQIAVGHIKTDSKIIQVMDTPGLLDRPLNERNPIELQAITALKHATTLIIFMLDPSETCGYPIDYQLDVLESVREIFRTDFMIVLNKIDICNNDKINYAKEQLKMRKYVSPLEISVKLGINIDKLRELIIKKF
ncbi:MAG: NOG1 family protein [Thermoprotei archaeon]